MGIPVAEFLFTTDLVSLYLYESLNVRYKKPICGLNFTFCHE